MAIRVGLTGDVMFGRSVDECQRRRPVTAVRGDVYRRLRGLDGVLINHVLVDEGVDVVHCHSAHRFQGVEVYDDRMICYDIGDFVDDYAVDARVRNDRSFSFELTVTVDGRVRELRLLPTEIRDCAVYRARGRAVGWSRERMGDLSAPFGMTFTRDRGASGWNRNALVFGV